MVAYLGLMIVDVSNIHLEDGFVFICIMSVCKNCVCWLGVSILCGGSLGCVGV